MWHYVEEVLLYDATFSILHCTPAALAWRSAAWPEPGVHFITAWSNGQRCRIAIIETADRWKVHGRRLTLIDIVTNVPLFTPSDWNHSSQKWSKHAQAIQNHWNEPKPKPYSKSQITTKRCNAKVIQWKTLSAPIHTNRCQPFTWFLMSTSQHFAIF